MAILITCDGNRSEVNPKNSGENFSLKELQSFVCGYIEIISLPRNKFLVVNEDGRLLQLESNKEATKVAGQQILGNAVLCSSEEV